MQAKTIVESYRPLINFNEKAQTPSNAAVLLHAQVSVRSGHFYLVKK